MSLLSVNKKGKFIVGGIVTFALIATASTGLAAWVIGQTTNGEDQGDITITTDIKDSSVAVTMDDGADLTVNFGPNGAGEVISASGNSEEDLNFTIKGTVQYLETVVKVETVTVKIAPIDEKFNGYIDMPEDFEYSEDEAKYIATIPVTDKAFEKEFSFRWGSETEGQNPCEFFKAGSYADADSYLDSLVALNGTTFDVVVSPNVNLITNNNQ